MSPAENLDARALVGECDILMLTLDTLRMDVAAQQMACGATPNFQRLFGRWQRRHTPASFTYAAHLAFFAGFLPTPAGPGPHARLFAVEFEGSESTASTTAVFDAPDIVRGLSAAGYRTICIGGVGFFNPETQLGRTLVAPFDEAHWSPDIGVTARDSTPRQVELARARLDAFSDQRVFLFVNVSALHQPNCHYVDGANVDTPQTQAAALAYVDSALPPLFDALAARGPTLCVVTSDHGTAYGDDGYRGHRCAHRSVWDVPYAEFMLPAAAAEGA